MKVHSRFMALVPNVIRQLATTPQLSFMEVKMHPVKRRFAPLVGRILSSVALGLAVAGIFAAPAQAFLRAP